jgi:hypothetical protein
MSQLEKRLEKLEAFNASAVEVIASRIVDEDGGVTYPTEQDRLRIDSGTATFIINRVIVPSHSRSSQSAEAGR